MPKLLSIWEQGQNEEICSESVWFLGVCQELMPQIYIGLECAKVRRNENTHVIGKWILQGK